MILMHPISEITRNTAYFNNRSKSICDALQACNITKINTPEWVFFTVLKLCKWYQIAQRIT